MTQTLKLEAPLSVSYCIPDWLRDEQVKLAIQKVPGRIQARYKKRSDPIAVVGFGPSLRETWPLIKSMGFKKIITTSGAHKFLIEKGIIPTWHVEVDPREHKIELLGPPHKKVTYLPCSACHPKYFDHLVGYKVQLWHVFSNNAEAQRILPKGEWALTGGSNVGLRAMAIARFFGFTNLHVFGMDGSFKEDGTHAGPHPNQSSKKFEVEYPEGSGQMWNTLPTMLFCAKETFHELDMMQDVTATFHGEGLIQEMAKHYVRKPRSGTILAMTKKPVISEEYRALNKALHDSNPAYGVGAGRWGPTVQRMAVKLDTTSILDYGCGKGYLAKSLPFPIWEYDPAVPGKDAEPKPADIVCCFDVLEHIEPKHLDAVLDDLRRCTKKVGYFIISCVPSKKFLADGRNAHLIQKPGKWWHKRLEKFFTVERMMDQESTVHVVVSQRRKGK